MAWTTSTRYIRRPARPASHVTRVRLTRPDVTHRLVHYPVYHSPILLLPLPSVPECLVTRPWSSTMVRDTPRWGESEICYPNAANLRFAGNSEPSFVFPTVIATHQTSSASTTSSSGSGRAPPPVAGKPSHLASKRGIEDLDFYIGDEAIANSK